MPHPTGNPDEGSLELTEDIIRAHAYRFYEDRGCEDGHDLEDLTFAGSTGQARAVIQFARSNSPIGGQQRSGNRHRVAQNARPIPDIHPSSLTASKYDADFEERCSRHRPAQIVAILFSNVSRSVRARSS